MSAGTSERRVDVGLLVAGVVMVTLYVFGLLRELSTSFADLLGPFTDPAEGPVEAVQALIWLLSGIAFFISAAAFARARRDGERLSRTVLHGAVLWPAFFGLVCIAACGEEISWGQHLGLVTPSEDIAAINTQGELNVHNVNVAEILGLDADDPVTPFLRNFGGVLQPAFYAFWFTAWVVIPFIVRRGWPPRAFWRGYPLATLGVAVFLTVNLIAWFIIDKFYEVTELLELAIGIATLLVAAPLVRRALSRTNRDRHSIGDPRAA